MDTEKTLKEIICQMQKSLECSICLELLNSPISTKCDHQFCSFCILKFLQNKQSVPCPLCKKPITKRGLQERTDLMGVVAHVKKLISAFEADTGKRTPPRSSPKKATSEKIIKCTSDTSSKSDLLNDAVNLKCQDPKSVICSKIKCRVSNKRQNICAKNDVSSNETVSSEEMLIMSEDINKTSGDLQNEEKQKLVELMQYLENGHCGEKQKSVKSNSENHTPQGLLSVDKKIKDTNTDISEKSFMLNKEIYEFQHIIVGDLKHDKLRTYKNDILEEDINKKILSASPTVSKINSSNENPIRRSTRNISRKQVNELPFAKKSAELISQEGEPTVSQCSSSSSVSSVSSTQQFTKPKPVVSRTYSKGMQNVFHAEGCVRNWVETLPKVSDNHDDMNHIKRLTTKEKINVKKRSSFHLVTEETCTSNVSSKIREDTNTEIKSGSGDSVLECQFTPRPKRNIFKLHLESTVTNKNVVANDPFEFITSQSPTKVVNIKTRKRKKSKGENKSEQMASLNFISSADCKTWENEKTVGQHNEIESNKVVNQETFASLPLDCEDNAVDGKNVQNERDLKNNCPNYDSITNNRKEEVIDTVASENGDISFSKCRAVKKKALQNKNETYTNEELFILSQRSGNEMMKLIDKISQAECHELLFNTQEIHKKMDESLQNNQNEVCQISTSQTYSMALSSNVSVIQNTDIVEDSMTVTSNVEENSEPGMIGEIGMIPSEIHKFCDSNIVAETERNLNILDRVCGSEVQKSKSIKQQDIKFTVANDSQKKSLKEMGHSLNLINVPDDSETLKNKCKKLSQISQAPKPPENPKTPLANKSFNSLIIQKIHPLLDTSMSPQAKSLNRSFSSRFPLPNLKEMIQVSPGPKGFIPVLNNSNVTNSSQKCDDKISKESQVFQIEDSELAKDTHKNILVTDTVIEAGYTEIVSDSQDQVIQETLDACDVSITRPRASDNTNINQSGLEFAPDTDSKIDVDKKLYQQIIMETQYSSSHSPFNVEKESDTSKETLNRETVKELTGKNEVSLVDNLQSENPQETPSTLSQSILQVNHKECFDQDILSDEKEDDRSVKKKFLKRRKNNLSIETDSGAQAHDASPKKALPSTVSMHKKIVSTDSLSELFPKRAELIGKHKKPCDSISSAPSKYNSLDSEDEDSVLIVRRSKRRCFSLNNTPLKPVVFGSNSKDTVNDIMSETEVVESLVNCTENDKNIDASSETPVRTDLLAADSELDCQIPHESLSDSLLAPETQKISILQHQKDYLLSVTENLQTDVCSEGSKASNNISGSLQTGGTLKTRRGLASKKILFEVDNLPKHVLQETSKYEKPDIRLQNNNTEVFVVEDSETEQEENSKQLLSKKLDCDVEKVNKPFALSMVSLENIRCDSKENIQYSLNSNNCEDLLKKQLEKELFGDERIKSNVTQNRSELNPVMPNKKCKFSKAESLCDKEEVSFDLGLFTVDSDNSSAEIKKCVGISDNKEIIPEQTLDVNNKNASLKFQNSIQQLNISLPIDCEETNQENETVHLGSPPLTSSPLQDVHDNVNSDNHNNLSQSTILIDKEDNVDDEDDDDCARIKKKVKRQMIASDSDASDCEDLTRSSFMSSQSETLTTQQQLALEGDLEKLHQEIAKYEAELKKQSSTCLSQDRNSKEFHSSSLHGDSTKTNPLVIDDSPVENDEDSNDLFQSPDYSPKPFKEKQGLSGIKKSRPCPSQVTDHFLKQFQSPGGSVRSKKCLEFIASGIVRVSGSSNTTKSTKRLSKADMQLQKLDSRKRHVDKVVDEDIDEDLSSSPVLVTLVKNQSAETKSAEENDKKMETHNKMFLIASGLSKDDHLLLLKFCDKFGAVLYPKFTKEVSHVIMKPAKGYELVCDRTLKFFQGVANKCWVLSFSWIVKSLEAGNLLSEAGHEIEGDTSFGEKVNGAKHARLSKIPLFDNFSFACIGNSEEMSKENLSDILQVSGAVIVDDPIALTAQLTKYKLIIRCSDGDNVPSSVELDMFNGLFKHMKLLTVMREWVLDSLSSYKLIPLDDYVLITADQNQLPF